MFTTHTTIWQSILGAGALALMACGDVGPEAPFQADPEALGASAVLGTSPDTPTALTQLEVLDLQAYRIDARALAALDLVVPAPVAFRDGEVCLVPSTAWGATCGAESPAGCLRDQAFETLYGEAGVEVGFNGNVVRFTQPEWLSKALPGEATPVILDKAYVDPEADQLNRLAGELIALRMTVDFNAMGLLGTASLADAIVVVGPLAELSVVEVLEMGEWALGGFTDKMERRGLDLNGLTEALVVVNHMAPDCQAPSDLARVAAPR